MWPVVSFLCIRMPARGIVEASRYTAESVPDHVIRPAFEEPPMPDQMLSLPIDATDASRTRYDLARELAQACPSSLGQEIALTGSAWLGIADDARRGACLPDDRCVHAPGRALTHFGYKRPHPCFFAVY